MRSGCDSTLPLHAFIKDFIRNVYLGQVIYSIEANISQATKSVYATFCWSLIVTLVLFLPHFRHIVGFLFRTATPSLFHPNFRGVTLGLDCQCCGSEERRL